MVWTSVAVVFAGLVVAGDAQADPVQQEFDRLQGTWVVVGAEREGQALDRIKGNILIIKDRNFTIKTQSGIELKGDLNLDLAQKPRRMEMAHQEGPIGDKTWQAIYLLDGDDLKICYLDPDAGKERPQEFSTAPDSGHQLVILRREKP